MDKKNSVIKAPRQFAMDKQFNAFVVLGLATIALGAFSFDENDIGFFVFLMLLGTFFIAGGAFAIPYGYFFDKDGVSVMYVFYSEERYLWRNIYYIMATYDSLSSRNPILDLVFSQVFEIGGDVEGKHRFYMNGHIRKSRRTRKLIEKYWDGRITKEGENTKKKSKKAKELKLLSDEVAALERQVRAESRRWVEAFKGKAESLGLEIRSEYIYITPNFDERKSRPNSPYKYTMILEICNIGEKDEDKIILIDADLINVRLGKRAYRGVINKKAEAEFYSIMEQTLDEIRKNGIEGILGGNEESL
ncbi:MAG: hypothetical protein E7675_01130 [Ruminococcaceae bacterium]|nr:hypothetical protein [Oscillospiraceae bacterium]